MDRRRFLTTSTATVLSIALRDLPLLGRQGQSSAAFEPLRRGVGIFNGQGGTIGWLVNGDGVLVVDSQNAASAEACISGIAERSARDIDLLINTHHHADHTGGNATFRPVVGSIVAHESSARWQRQTADANTDIDQALPDVTFADEWRTTIGDETIVARHHGPGHTSGDAVVTFEQANVVHMGDLMFNRLHPFVDRSSGARIDSWIETLDAVASAHDANTLYVFGHGSPDAGVTGTQEDLAHLRDYFSAALELAVREMQAGHSKEELIATTSLPGFDDHLSPFPLLSLSGVLGVAYDELSE